MTKKVNLIVAVDTYNGFSLNDEIPWGVLKPDIKRFYHLTKNTTVIMGRKTWESLVRSNVAPLKNRMNYVISRNPDNFSVEAVFFTNLTEAINNAPTDTVFLIGGQEIYHEAIEKNIWNTIYITRIFAYYECDRYISLPVLQNGIVKYLEDESFDSESRLSYCYETYVKCEIHALEPFYTFSQLPSTVCFKTNQEETQYLKILEQLLNAPKRKTRNGTTRSIFSPPPMEFDLSDGSFPVLTTKRIWIKGVFEELIWFLSGSTNSKELEAKGINIWKGNSSREFLDSRGLQHFPEGEIGETYGALFRNWGNSIDQVTELINKIKNNPTDRRLIINLFKPDSIEKCALPPCLCWYQFYCESTSTNEVSTSNSQLSEGMSEGVKPPSDRVRGLEANSERNTREASEKQNSEKENNFLDLFIHIRSSDFCLGCPWNILTGAFMLILIAKVTNRKPRRLIVNLGDTHIYEEHVELFRIQLTRQPKEFPTIKIDKELNTLDDILNLKFEEIKINNYNPFPSIKAEMVA